MVEEMEGERGCVLFGKGKTRRAEQRGPLLYASCWHCVSYVSCLQLLSHTHTNTQAAASLLYAHTMHVAKPLHIQVGQFVNGCGYFGTGAQPLAL